MVNEAAACLREGGSDADLLNAGISAFFEQLERRFGERFKLDDGLED